MRSENPRLNLSGLRCLLNVKVELSGRHLAMNPEFRRKSGHTYKYLVLRPNEREEVYYLDTGMFQNLRSGRRGENKKGDYSQSNRRKSKTVDFLEGRRSVLKRKEWPVCQTLQRKMKMKGNH